MKYVKYFEFFDINKEVNNLNDIISELRDDYFEAKAYDTKEKDKHGYFFKSLVKAIKDWENSYSFTKKFGLKPLEDINKIILLSINLQNKKFLWNAIENPVLSAISYMEFNGWRYVIQPVWNDTSMNFSIEDMDKFDIQEMQSFHIKFYC